MFSELLTNRLRLRSIREEDCEIIFEKWAQDKEITKFTTWQPHKNIEETKQYIRACLDGWNRQNYTWIIEKKDSKEVVGCFEARQKQHKVDIGYLVRKSQWSKGYMTEVIEFFIKKVFKIEGIKRVWAVCDIENFASKRVMEKAGMKYEGVLKSWLVHPNISPKPRDCHCLSIVKNV